jgi:hypothetical protein
MDGTHSIDIQKTTNLAVEENASTIVGDGGVMTNEVPKFVTQAKASYLLGIPEAELRRISNESGLGHVERAGSEEEAYFTYEELQRIYALAAYQKQTHH